MGGSIEGHLEAVVDGRAVGWAWDPQRPQEPLEVEVLVDEEPVATARADVERPVLAAAGIGDGRYGFDVPLPGQLAQDSVHVIRVTAGPERQEVAAARDFETLVRGGGAWQGIEFVTAGSAKRPFVPGPEDPPPTAAAALVGKRGWLFPWDEEGLSQEQLEGAPLIAADAVEREGEAIARRWRQLRDLRIPYLFAVAPLKERIYRRFLPDGASLHAERPVAQIDRALRATSSFEVFDLLPPLREARQTGRLFPRTDSGWSDRGAYIAYRELMREVGKRVVAVSEPPLPQEVPLLARPGFRGDLAGQPKLRLLDGSLVPAGKERRWEEETEVADVSGLRALRMPAPQHLEVTPHRAPHLYEIDDPALPRAVLVGDASCLKLIPWLAEHFSRFVFLWTEELPWEAIELEMPDLVIHVVAERSLLRTPSGGG
jgi:SGNH hydrolase-like domain, acetyltransferase AlgX